MAFDGKCYQTTTTTTTEQLAGALAQGRSEVSDVARRGDRGASAGAGAGATEADLAGRRRRHVHRRRHVQRRRYVEWQCGGGLRGIARLQGPGAQRHVLPQPWRRQLLLLAFQSSGVMLGCCGQSAAAASTRAPTAEADCEAAPKCAKLGLKGQCCASLSAVFRDRLLEAQTRPACAWDAANQQSLEKWIKVGKVVGFQEQRLFLQRRVSSEAYVLRRPIISHAFIGSCAFGPRHHWLSAI